jgi:GST-like protein
MIKFYYNMAPNPMKVALCLEEMGLPYEPVPVDTRKGEQHSPEFLAINPNAKVPVIIDDGETIFDSNAILLYLAEKTGKFIPQDAAGRYETIQWLMFQMGGIGPMFGQLGFFHKFAGKEYEDKRPRDRYVAESRRLLTVLEQRFTGRNWIMGDAYTIADIAILPWVRNLIGFYEAGDLVGIADFPQVKRVLEAFVARPAVKKGLDIPKAA